MKLNKLNNKDIIYIIVIILGLIIAISMPFVDKARCIKKGGIYVWEYSEGTKCHFKGE